jgi:hypothetical protein
MLSYRCTNTCRHCLYRCSPQQPDEWMGPEVARLVCEALATEPELQALHIAGGEPTLRMDLLLDFLLIARSHHLPVAYVETNASWCDDRARTAREMERLREAGLPGILVSVSMFHNEFVPFAYTRNCVEAAQEIFGPSNVIVYLPHMYELLARMPDDGTHTLDEFSRWTGIADHPDIIPRLYQVIPAGRAPQALRRCYTARPAEQYVSESCRADLVSTTHFHIDHHGDLFTGLCAGIAPADVENLHPSIGEDTHPVFCALSAAGPFGLMEEFAREQGFRPAEEGYVSKCDLCFAVRRFLAGTGNFSELRPASFYL